MGKKLTVEEVEKRIERVHGSVVTLDRSTFVNPKIKARLFDRDYGEWWATPENVFLRKSGHPLKGEIKRINKKKIKPSIIKDKIEKIHNGIVVLDIETYVNTRTKARFVDKDFGDFWTTAQNVLKGHGHPQRGLIKRSKSRTIPVEVIAKRLKNVHGNLVSIYVETYVNMHTKSKFNCLVYGDWWAVPRDVLSGQGHPLGTLKKTEATFLKKYGVKHVLQNEEIRKKMEKTILKNFGFKHASQSKEIQEKTRNTNLKKYGVDHPSKTLEVAQKSSRGQAKITIKNHWKTGEELVCQASWEPKVVEYLNANRIDFEWQSKIFTLPIGKTYRPDLYLKDSNIWVEIKGFFRKDAKEKWDWFKSEHPTAELWNKDKLKEMGIL